MIIYYRISDGGYAKEKLSVSKADCLANFLTVWGFFDEEATTAHDDTFFLIRDNLSDATWQTIKPLINRADDVKHKCARLRLRIYTTSEGSSAQSFRYAFSGALTQHWKDDAIVYFVEDDYLHTANARKILLEGLERVDYVSGYDNPDKYINWNMGGNPLIRTGGEETLVFTTKSHHWKLTNSTTMTFLTKIGILREDKDIFLKHTEGTYPLDYKMWLELREKGRALATPIPGVSTHIETKWLSPFIIHSGKGYIEDMIYL